MSTFPRILIICAAILTAGLPVISPASHAPGHPDPDPYNCTVLVEKPNGRVEEEQLGKIDCILHKLDRIERRMGCPLDDYLDGTCPYSPADTTATFCISQGREGGIDAEFGAETNAEIKLGAGWPNAIWGEAVGRVDVPIVIPPLIPIPTELNVTGAASLGRNFDICLEVPLEAATQLGPLELVADAEVIDEIVRAINEPQVGAKSKFQRRLGRLADYAIFRVPGTNRFQIEATEGHQSELARVLGDDGEAEFDFVEDAIDRLMAGEFGSFGDGGPMEILKSPVVQDLAMVFELPSPVTEVLSDPDMVVGQIFELLGLGASAAYPGYFEAPLIGLEVCNRIGLNQGLRDRFPQVGAFCSFFDSLPAFGQTTGIFAVVATIKSIVDGLPTLDEITSASCSIAGWACPPET